MVTTFTWTQDTIKDVIMALDVSLGRVPEQSVAGTAIEDKWKAVRQWLNVVNQALSKSDSEDNLSKVPPFPLSGQELRALQGSIDRIAQARATASSSRVRPSPAHVHQSLARLRASSYWLIGVLLASLAASILNLIIWGGTHEEWLVGIDVGLAIFAIGIWFTHNQALGKHRGQLQDAYPPNW